MAYDWIPLLEGKYLTYDQWFAFVGCFVSGVLAIVCFFAMFVSACLQAQTEDDDLEIVKKAKTTPAWRHWFNLGFWCLSCIPMVLGALSRIGSFSSIFFMFSVFMVKAIIQRCFFGEKFQKKTIYRALGYSVAMTIVWCRFCLCFYNTEAGFYSPSQGFAFNTQLTRFFQMKESCPPGPPCHMYVTVPEDVATSAFINVHTHKSIKSLTVLYDLEENYIKNKVTGYSSQAQVFDIQGIEHLGARNVHTALITNLVPNSKYLVQVFYKNSIQMERIYKTVPDTLDAASNITMVNGGDAGSTTPAKFFNNLLAKLNPDLLFVGGDNAYDDNMNSCYYTWDWYFWELEASFAKLGYMFPVIWAVGNHDVGLNENPGINITQNLEGPQYLNYLPQHYDTDENFTVIKQVPQIGNRRTVFYHNFAGSTYISLDSGYLHPYDGWQEDYLEEMLSQNEANLKFVHYHVPTYSACKRSAIDEASSLKAAQHWNPKFDKYRVVTVYENHVHAFKRTFPLKNNIPVENGTVYLGDGAYGAIPSSCQLATDWDIFAALGTVNNIWVDYISQKTVTHVAYNASGAVIDFYDQPTAYYLGK